MHTQTHHIHIHSQNTDEESKFLHTRMKVCSKGGKEEEVKVKKWWV